MAFRTQHTFTKLEVKRWPIPNSWDIVALLLVATVLILLGFGTKAMVGRYELGQTLSISLSPWMLPYYALRSVMRMLLALILSTVVTFLLGTWAAKSRAARTAARPARASRRCPPAPPPAHPPAHPPGPALPWSGHWPSSASRRHWWLQ